MCQKYYDIYKILNNFFVFDKYKNNTVVLLTLGSSKKIVVLLNLGKSIAWTLIFNLNKTALGETGCLSNPYFLLTGCLGIQIF